MKFICGYYKGLSHGGCDKEAVHFYLYEDEPLNPFVYRCEIHDMHSVFEVSKEDFLVCQVMAL